LLQGRRYALILTGLYHIVAIVHGGAIREERRQRRAGQVFDGLLPGPVYRVPRAYVVKFLSRPVHGPAGFVKLPLCEFLGQPLRLGPAFLPKDAVVGNEVRRFAIAQVFAVFAGQHLGLPHVAIVAGL